MTSKNIITRSFSKYKYLLHISFLLIKNYNIVNVSILWVNSPKKCIGSSPILKKKDTLLFQTWLNVSKDPIVGIDRKVGSFWLRVKENYNNYSDTFEVREISQLKSRWHKLNTTVEKFVWCYRQTFEKTPK